MSVLKSKRGESAMQFIETARELEIYTIKQCARFPKRFMFLITKDIVALSKAVYNNVKAANSVYPTNAAKTADFQAVACCGQDENGGYTDIVHLLERTHEAM